MPFRPGTPKPPTSGIKKGFKYPRTLEKERVLEAMKVHIMSKAEALVAAQLEHAVGEAYMVLRRPDGTYAVATEEKQVHAAVAIGGEAFQVHTRAPNTGAFMALMDRAFGRPTETHEHSGTVTLDIRDALSRRRKNQT